MIGQTGEKRLFLKLIIQNDVINVIEQGVNLTTLYCL